MKTKWNLFFITIVAAFFVMNFTNANAQDKYAFATWSNQFNSSNDDAFYLYISDPVKNWYDNLSEDERKDWQTNFRTSGNRQSGQQLMKSHNDPIPEGGSYERFSSSADCKEAIANKVAKFKKDYSGYKKPVKVIYINLRQY